MLAEFPIELMKAKAAALLAGGLGIALAIQAYVVPFIVKMTTIYVSIVKEILDRTKLTH